MRTSSTGRAILPFLLLILLFLTPAFGQEWSVPCEPPPDTLRALEKLPPVRDVSLPFEARIAPLRSLAEKNPDDFFLQRYYQDAFRRSFFLADEYDRALSLYRARPSHPLSRYLEARLLMMVEPERSRRTFEELMAAHEGFVWPQLDLLQWTTLPGRRDPKEAESRLRQFLAVCPEAVEAYENARLVEDPELVSTAAANLRRALERRNSPLDAGLWPTLWTFESRAGGDAAASEERIRRDLERVDSLPFRSDPALLTVYRQAAEGLDDPRVLAELMAKVEGAAPQSMLHLWLLENQWRAENPPPGAGASREDHQAYQQRHGEAQREWAKQRQGACSLVRPEWMRMQMRRRQGQDPGRVSDADLALADEVLRCSAESPDAGFSMPPIQTMIAEFYVDNEVRLDAVPGLLDEGLALIEKQEKYRMSADLIPEEMKRRPPHDSISFTNDRTQHIRAKYLAAAGRFAEARGLVEQEIAKIDEAGTEAGDAAAARRRGGRRGWVEQLAAITAKEGGAEEALALYQSILGGVPREVLMNPDHPIVAPIRKLYLANGGNEEGWLEWAISGAPPREGPRERRRPVFSEKLPEFSGKDLAGRTWRLRDLEGKATFVNYWATWCGPCRAEHPEVQKLHDLVKSRDDIQVLTISVDHDPSAVTAYIKEKGYTFPAIHDAALADQILPYMGLPTNFLVNAAGMRTTFYGFWGGEQNLQTTVADLEEAAKMR